MDNNNIAFITCVNDEELYEECTKYIDNLNIPAGYSIEKIAIREAKSMTAAYNEAINKSDSKFKVYLHQDTFITNKNFILDFLKIFNDNKEVGMLGAIGAETLPSNAIWWQSKSCKGKTYESSTGKMELLNFDNNEVQGDYIEVEAIDGFIMVTQYDVKWRDDIFNGWHFYDLSQCMEFRKLGFKVVIPNQKSIWCVHDCGIVNIKNKYEYYRKLFLKIYLDSNEPKESIKNTNKFINKKLGLSHDKRNEIFEFDKIKSVQILNSNKVQFLQYVNIAEKYIEINNYEQAAKWCFNSAKFAAENHPGFYCSKEIEDILINCANNLPSFTDCISVPKKYTNKRRVLHVLSEGYGTGGHTRLIRNWINMDKESVHSLIATWQVNSTPNWLIDDIKKSGGWVHSLEAIDNFMDRAAALRKISYDWADVIVLHIHMFDTVPVMAFGVEGGPPVLFMNHADHVFWIGTSIIDRLINYRESGEDLSVKRRNVERSSILPLPLNVNSKLLNYREKIREDAGISDDTTILLTIASEYKFRTLGKFHYIDIMKKIIEDNKNTILIVIGPNNNGVWEKAYRETNGRILALGIKEDIDLYYEIADIYVDSYMIGSNTSALDAGLRGIPVVSLTNKNNPILSFNDVSYDLMIDNIEEFFYYVKNLILNTKYRKKIGNNLSDKIKRHHISEWNKYLNSLYDFVKNKNHKIYYSSNYENKIEEKDLFLALFQKS